MEIAADKSGWYLTFWEFCEIQNFESVGYEASERVWIIVILREQSDRRIL